MSSQPYIIIENGEPHEAYTEICLMKSELLLGRPWQDYMPDIPFSSLHVSKKHASIAFKDNLFTIMDLNSKHGTQVNGLAISPNKPHIMRDGDVISLAVGIVTFRFYGNDADVDGLTMDLAQEEDTKDILFPALVINIERREVLLEGKELHLFGKDIDLLLTLYINRGKAVSYDEIRSSVWPERPVVPPSNIPDVGTDEINALVYRLRKRLGNQGSLVVTVPRYGYRLDL